MSCEITFPHLRRRLRRGSIARAGGLFFLPWVNGEWWRRPIVHQVAIQKTLAEIRAKAQELREAFGDEARARTLEWAARKVEQALRDESDELLTLSEASEISGYNPDSLARMVRDGQIPDLRPQKS